MSVNPGVTLTIAPAGILSLDLKTKKLLVKDTGKVFIRQGGSIRQTPAIGLPPTTVTVESSLIFHHSDHLSSASLDTDTEGNIVQLTDYYPYGDSRIEEATTAFHNDYTYTGKERDEDTELLYYEARYYDSRLGRFISLDPWGGEITDPQSFNKYAYVRNNPLKYVDPDGRQLMLIPDEQALLPYYSQQTSSYGEGTDWRTEVPVLAQLDALSILLTGNGLWEQDEYAGKQRYIIGFLGLLPNGKKAGKSLLYSIEEAGQPLKAKTALLSCKSIMKNTESRSMPET